MSKGVKNDNLNKEDQYYYKDKTTGEYIPVKWDRTDRDFQQQGYEIVLHLMDNNNKYYKQNLYTKTTGGRKIKAKTRKHRFRKSRRR